MPERPAPAALQGRRTRTLLAVRDLAFHQEVLDFLERDPRIDVVGAVAQTEGFFRAERATSPEVIVACPILTRDVRHPAGSGRTRHLLVVGEEMTVTLLRDAIDSGARGVFAWPDERADLATTIAAARGIDPDQTTARGASSRCSVRAVGPGRPSWLPIWRRRSPMNGSGVSSSISTVPSPT
jgi:hypothetical protein